jgi:hypothetical protein
MVTELFNSLANELKGLHSIDDGSGGGGGGPYLLGHYSAMQVAAVLHHLKLD